MSRLKFLAFLLVFACSGDDGSLSEGSSQDWIIPAAEVIDGGPGKDGIPSIDNPIFAGIEEEEGNINDSDLVVVVAVGQEVRAYPHNILDWHEIVNDRIESLNIALTYCPLTGTAIGWDREVDGQVTSFGVSGLLYNSNLMPYDRNTDSYWSQMLNQSVRGANVSREIARYPVVEMTWKAFKNYYPDGLVLTRRTGVSRRYGDYPYGDYRSNGSLLFPVSHSDNRIFGKARVHGIQRGGITRVYQFSDFETNSVVTDQVDGTQVVLFGNKEASFIVSFEVPQINGEELLFSAIEGESPDIVAGDQFGNEWNIFGKAISGPNTGQQLVATSSYMGFYFSWVAFNGNVEIFGG